MITSSDAKFLEALWETWAYGPADRNRDCARLIDLTTAETKSHDGFRASGIRRGLTITQEARYFALKRLAEYVLLRKDAPKLAGYWHYQQSCYGAYALVVDASTQAMVREWADKNRAGLERLLEWDYVEMIRA